MSTVSQSVVFCSGYGQFHTNKPDAENRKPYATISMADIQAMASTPTSVAKEKGQWVIFSDYTGEHGRNAEYLRNNGALFYALWGDIDEAAGVTAEDILKRTAFGVTRSETIVYTSRSATEANQKARIIVPLAEPVDAITFEIMQEVLNNKLEAEGLKPDRVTETCQQLCYLPNKGKFYWSDSLVDFDGYDPLNPTAWAKEVAAIVAEREAEEEARAARMVASAARYAELIATQGASPIDACNEAYGDPRDLLIHYGGKADGVRVVSPNSSTGSAGVTFKDGKWFSSHGSDVSLGLGRVSRDGRSCFGDSFDLVCFFEFGNDRTRAVREMAARFQPAENKARQVAHAKAKDASEIDAMFTPEIDASVAHFDAMFTPPASANDETPSVVIPNGWDLAENAKPARYLVDGILEEDAHGIFGGASMTYKTFTALRLAHSICSGKPFAGREVYKKGSVVYVCGEGQGSVQRRLKALLIKCGKPEYMIDIVPGGVSLTCPTSMARLLERIKPLKPVLVVFDTFASLSGGIEENSNSEVGAALNLVRDTCRAAGASSLIIHHFGKNTDQGFRGASAFTNNVDFAFMAHKRGGENSRESGLTCHKMKDGEHFSEIFFKTEIVHLGIYDQKGQESTSLVAEHDSTATPNKALTQDEIMLRELRHLQSVASITSTTDDPSWITWKAWSTAAKEYDVKNLSREKDKLIARGQVAENKGKFRAL